MIEIYVVLYCFDVMNFRGQYPFEIYNFQLCLILCILVCDKKS